MLNVKTEWFTKAIERTLSVSVENRFFESVLVFKL